MHRFQFSWTPMAEPAKCGWCESTGIVLVAVITAVIAAAVMDGKNQRRGRNQFHPHATLIVSILLLSWTVPQ